MRYLLLFLGALPAWAQTPAPLENLDLLLLTGPKPVRLEIAASIDGQPVARLWSERVRGLFDYLDRDRNGSLDKVEAARMPTPFVVRQLLWGSYAPTPIASDSFTLIDTDRNERLSPTEFQSFYERAGLGHAIVGIGRPTTTTSLTKAISQRLDTNQDGTIGVEEWKNASKVLQKLDTNEDDLIDPSEILPHTVYPGATGGTLLTATTKAPTLTLVDTFPLLRLPSLLGDTDWQNAANRRTRLPVTEFATIRTNKPGAAWNIAFNSRDANEPRLSGHGVTEAPSDARLDVEGANLLLRRDRGRWADFQADARKRFALHFADCDADSNRQLDASEFALAKAAQFKSILPVADRNGDQQLAATELDEWLKVMEQLAAIHVLITVLDHEQGLFEFIDTNYDGALSLRELRAMATRSLSVKQRPLQIRIIVSRGTPTKPLGTIQRVGPEWFKAMDRNGDGDVSRQEFTGKPDVFTHLDLNADDVLDVSEADKATPKKPS